MLGELIAEFKGKATGIRVLADGKIEASNSGSGNILGEEASSFDTGVAMMMPNGVFMLEGNAIVKTEKGDVVMFKENGIGGFTGKGLKTSFRGACYFMTSSLKLASLNKTAGVYEFDSDEKGEFSYKAWVWK